MVAFNFLRRSPKSAAKSTTVQRDPPLEQDAKSSQDEASVESPEIPKTPQDVAPPAERPAHHKREGTKDSHAPSQPFRFSFRGWGLFRHERAASSSSRNHEKAKKHPTLGKALHSSSKKRAKESALLVRSVIVGPSSASPKVSPVIAHPQMNKIRQQLSHPKTANKLIAQLRALPSSDAVPGGDDSKPPPAGPIRAVCLSHTDAEEDALHFHHLKETGSTEVAPQGYGVPIVTSEPMEQLTSMLNELRIVDLISQRDLGLGQPGDGKGLLAGALPTPETVINGFKQITPQLMALGYATGRAVLPDHAGVYPPTDRMSILTYWWGLEVVLPPPTLGYLSNANSVTGTVVNFLSALSLVNGGVREILPFVRYISQYIEFEFNAIKKQDKGLGVVCAATWIMPAALVPRPWDFPTPDSEDAKTTSVTEAKGGSQSEEEKLDPDSKADELIGVDVDVDAGPTLPS